MQLRASMDVDVDPELLGALGDGVDVTIDDLGAAWSRRSWSR